MGSGSDGDKGMWPCKEQSDYLDQAQEVNFVTREIRDGSGGVELFNVGKIYFGKDLWYCLGYFQMMRNPLKGSASKDRY